MLHCQNYNMKCSQEYQYKQTVPLHITNAEGKKKIRLIKMNWESTTVKFILLTPKETFSYPYPLSKGEMSMWIQYPEI